MTETNPTRRTRQIAIFATLLIATALVAHARSSAPPVGSGAPAAATAAPSQPVVADTTPPRIEVAFVLDTTGSMSGLIEGAKQKIWSIANQMASGQPQPEIRIGLIGYRDRGDAYITRFHDLDTDVDALYGHLQAFGADGGGDGPESVNQALHEAVTRMSWTRQGDVYRVIFLVGDAPPHMDYPDDVPFTESVRVARRQGIVVNTVQCGTLGSTTPVWQQIATSGEGRYVSIRQDGGMLALATPMDDELAHLNRELAGTVVTYGAVEERAELEAKRMRALAAPAPAAASRLSFLSKLGGRVNSGRADLVDAVKDGIASVADLADDLLPADMQPLSVEEREAYVAKKSQERAALSERIGELSSDRDAYVKAELARRSASGKADGFDDEVFETIRDQAASAGIAY